MKVFHRALGIACAALLLVTPVARAQSQTGAITGEVTDTSGAVLPGVTISVSGDKLIGGVQTKVTDATGNYRFDRLPPGSYNIKFELQGFKTIDRQGIRITALFVATVSPKLEVGNVSETITVTGDSPTIDTKSNVQQTVMTQEILEGVPTGRDPWSLAKIIPGVQISTYDVGGTQSYQQSSLSSHGSNTNDVNYNIDGNTVNWPGGGGGATMLYYDQGMFEEVNYTTSAIPAEVMVGGVSINMVTKEAGNKWRGDMRYNYSNGTHLQADNTQTPELTKWGFLGSPITRLYDFNIGGGGAVVKDKLWVTGSLRRWLVNQVTNARNADGSRAVDDNLLYNYSGKGVWQASQSQKISFAVNYDNKIRGHRRNTPPNFVPDIASLHQNNPATSYQAKYTGIRNKAVYESSLSIMSGQTRTSIRTAPTTRSASSTTRCRPRTRRRSITKKIRIRASSSTTWCRTRLPANRAITRSRPGCSSRACCSSTSTLSTATCISSTTTGSRPPCRSGTRRRRTSTSSTSSASSCRTRGPSPTS